MADRMTLSSTPVMKVNAPTNTWEVAISAALLLQNSPGPQGELRENKYEPETCRQTHLAVSCRRRRIFIATEVRPTTLT